MADEEYTKYIQDTTERILTVNSITGENVKERQQIIVEQYLDQLYKEAYDAGWNDAEKTYVKMFTVPKEPTPTSTHIHPHTQRSLWDRFFRWLWNAKE